MAQPDLDFFTKRGVVGKIEVTEGTDSIPAAATDGILLLNGRSGTEFDKVERPIDRPFFTNNSFGVANERAFIEGEFELFCPDDPGVENTVNHLLLVTAGMQVTLVNDPGVELATRYTPISTGIPSGSFRWWHVDKRKNVVGARSAISRLGMAIGQRFMGNGRILGTLASLTEEAIPAITLYETVPVISTHSNSTAFVALGGGAEIPVWAKELAVDFGSQLASKEYTSKRVNAITNRLATWSMRIARTSLADFDPWVARRAGTLFESRYRLDEGNDLYSELGIRGQIETIEEVDIDGDYGWDLSGPCIASNAGGDELYVEHGNANP